MATKENKRVVFTFDAHSLADLEEMKEEGPYSSLAETVHDSLQITRSLQNLAKRGYSEIIVRDPVTEEERLLMIPTIRAVARKVSNRGKRENYGYRNSS